MKHILIVACSFLATPQFAFGQTSAGVKYTIGPNFERAEFIGLVRYTHIEPNPPYEAVSFQVWDLRPAQKTTKMELDTLLHYEVVRNMELVSQKPMTCPAALTQNFPGYSISCLRAVGKQDSNTYHFELIALRKGSKVQWLSITRSNNANLRKAEADKFIQSLKPDALAFSSKTP